MDAAATFGLDVELPDDMTQLLEFAMIIKGFGRDGLLHYWTVATPGITAVEAVGMYRWAGDKALGDAYA